MGANKLLLKTLWESTSRNVLTIQFFWSLVEYYESESGIKKNKVQIYVS